MDFITGLPKVLGNDCIFLVVDILTKFANLFSITTSFTGSQVAKLLFRYFFRFWTCLWTWLSGSTLH